MSNIDVNITLQQSKKVIRFNQIDGIGIIKEDGSMIFSIELRNQELVKCPERKYQG